MTICQGLRLFLLSLSFAASSTWAQTTTHLWPTVLFIKGQDLCQYEDAYASSRSAQVSEITSQLKDLMRMGASTPEGLDALLAIDSLVDKNRSLATTGTRMDITLEASLKAYLDRMYLGFSPKDIRLQFFNPAPLNEVLKTLRENPRNGVISNQQLAALSGFVWGTYAYGPGCKGDLVVTVHVEIHGGNSVSFQAQGKPENVMSLIAAEMVRHFQRTTFPTAVVMGEKTLVLIGTAGSPINKAPTPQIAERSCTLIKARLPTQDEYEFLSIMGDWNNGVSLDHKVWAMSSNRVLAPDMRNPSPVRGHVDVNYEEVYFYCVR
ncbi:hypothetical protein [Limnohabitans sp. B9-3]|uniref:hypothetical protein n=1 Tax=Limnohabitans sp. B9-3 TaxID=1100707 RepID=UPI000C1E6DFC|nr:hypothetical protein [Limnohabitans sp. B9-3]PIT78774.1 hypothetical protein B9Z42_01390 [Limnohabitans sp. B9-3]